MAEYIDDGGSYGVDAELTGTYTKDAPNKTLTMGGDGQADTTFILPSVKEWLLFEVFNVEDVSGDIGYTKWQSSVSQIATDLSTVQAIADGEYTNYEIVATHYNGDDTADVYRGDESTSLDLAEADTGIDYTPSASSWKITDTVIAPDGIVNIAALPAAFGVSDCSQNTVGDIITFTDSGAGTSYAYSRLSTTTPAFLTENVSASESVTISVRVRASSTSAYVRANGWTPEAVKYITAADTWETIEFTETSSGVNDDYFRVWIEDVDGTFDMDLSQTVVNIN